MSTGDQPGSINQFRIVEVTLKSPLLEEVILLHSSGKNRLGQFPRGAFEEHASRQRILAAISAEGQMAGYLLFRVAKSRAAIVHLTVHNAFRGKGVARNLVESLKQRTRHLLGISLSCRRSYGIDDMWQEFGFSVRHSKQGRSADGAILDCWWFDHKHEDLFSQAVQEDASDRVLAAIDANVFFDLVCDARPHSEDTKALQADWLQDSILLCITRELFNEIHRAPTEEEKKRCRMAAQTFHELKTDDSELRAIETKLQPVFNGATFQRDISDMRQVAHAIAAEVPFFVTRDTPVLGRSEAIFEMFGLRILHPTELVNRLDLLRREVEYRPARLEGSSWHARLVVAADLQAILSSFKHPSRERASAFEQQVRHFFGNPKMWRSSIVADSLRRPAVYLVQSANDALRVEVPFLRHTDHPLAGTLLRHLVHELTRHSHEAPLRIINIKDSELSEDVRIAIEELGFLPDEKSWWKISVRGVCERQQLISQIRRADVPAGLKERLIGAAFLTGDVDGEPTRVRLESLFSPVKLVAPEAPSFVVSIRKSWAEHFFDIPLGGQTLMDLNEKLHLGIEGAYYCAATNTHVTAPARILWYVSGKGSMCIKACSHLEERFIKTPKELYAQFRHLGVYTWKNVLATAKGELDHPLMAFKFSRTERFARPVTLAELLKMGVPQPQNPRRISDDQFRAIYQLGMNL